MGDTSSKPEGKRSIGAAALRISTSLAIMLLFFAMDRGPELLPEFASRSSLAGWLATAGTFAQRLVTFTPFPKDVRFVSVVTLSKESVPEGALQNACLLRQHIAQLLLRLIDFPVRVVVLDFAFEKTGCPESDPGSQSLRQAVRALTARSKVVVGIPSATTEEAEVMQVLTPEQISYYKLGPNELIVEDYFHLDGAGPDSLLEGLLQVNEDRRRVPLGWLARRFKDRELARDPEVVRSLSIQAAWAYQDSPWIRTVSGWDFHPITVLQQRIQFAEIPSVCLAEWTNPNFNWNGDICQHRVGPRSDAQSSETALRGLMAPIVVIGRVDDERDLHEAFPKLIPGVFLQANYIESLLGTHTLFKPISLPVQLLLSLIWFAPIEWLLWKRELKWALYVAIASSLLVICVSYFAVNNLGYYLTLWPPSLVAIVLRIIQEWMRDKLADLSGGTPESVSQS